MTYQLIDYVVEVCIVEAQIVESMVVVFGFLKNKSSFCQVDCNFQGKFK
jgi:hypothetical protein